MDYYQSMRNDYVHKAMYPEDPMRVDWIPKGPAQGTLTIKPKERCPPRFVSRIEGNAVEESAKVFFEGIVDAQPQPKFSWYFEDEPIIPGHKGWEDAEIHDSRKMSTLILKYTREHHMGKYTLVAQNQLGAAECNCDLIVRKKQFPPVFWQRLYNVNGEGSRRFVGEVEVGGWPIPEVYWYKVNEDGEEEEVTSKTHTENWNGNPNKYVPDRRVEVRQLDQIRHVIIFHQVSDGDSGLYRVRAVNALGEAECEAELYFDGCGSGGSDLYLPPLWKERKRLNWKDEDQRKKPFVGFKEPELTAEDLAEMRKKCAGVPLGRIMEYLASLPNYVPSEKFRNMDRMPFQAGVDERDYRPDRKGGKCSFPSVFQKGDIIHRGYNTDALGRILPLWHNTMDPRSRDSSDWTWRPVHPELWIPELPPRSKSPPAPPVWESVEDIQLLVQLLNGMGCRVDNVKVIKADKKSRQLEKSNNNHINLGSTNITERKMEESVKQQTKSKSNIEKFSYIMPNEKKEQAEPEHLPKTKDVKAMWEEKLNSDSVGMQTNAADFTSKFMSQMYERRDNMSFPELEDMSRAESRPALPPKTKIMNSPSRNIFSPTESIESNGTGTASVKTVEFIPVKEKVKLIAAQQEELYRREETNDFKKHKGVRILPPSPVTVRKMSVEDELYQYDEVVTRSTPVTQVMEKMQNKPQSPVQLVDREQKSVFQSYGNSDYATVQKSQSNQYASSYEEKSQMSFHSQSTYSETRSEMQQKQAIVVPGWSSETNSRETQQKYLDTKANDQKIDSALDQLIAETENMVSNETLFAGDSAREHFQSYSSTSVTKSMTTNITSAQTVTTAGGKIPIESPAEECRRSFEEAELEAMALASEATSRSFSKQSSLVETASTQSFVMQQQNLQSKTALIQSHFGTKETNNEEESTRSRRPVKSSSFVRVPDTFTKPDVPPANSSPNTPMSQRRRLRINSSPKPPESECKPVKYRDGPSAPFQPGFYRAPPEDPEKSHVFQLVRRSSSRSRASAAGSTERASSQESYQQQQQQQIGVRVSQTSSKAYEGDESDVDEVRR